MNVLGTFEQSNQVMLGFLRGRSWKLRSDHNGVFFGEKDFVVRPFDDGGFILDCLFGNFLHRPERGGAQEPLDREHFPVIGKRLTRNEIISHDPSLFLESIAASPSPSVKINVHYFCWLKQCLTGSPQVDDFVYSVGFKVDTPVSVNPSLPILSKIDFFRWLSKNSRNGFRWNPNGKY